MSAHNRILIVGGGSAAIALANRLRRLNSTDDLSITLIGDQPKHFCKSDGTLISLGLKEYRSSVKATRFLLSSGIRYVRDYVTNIRVNEKVVKTGSNEIFKFDRLVLATGTVPATYQIPGYDGEGKHFRDLQHALELRKNIEKFKGGRVVVGLSGPPLHCPLDIHEFALLFAEMVKNGRLPKSEVHLVYPDADLFGHENISSLLNDLYHKMGVNIHTNFRAAEISQKNRELISESGEILNYDLLVLTPSVSGSTSLQNIGITDEGGLVRVDRETLKVEGAENLYAIGDATINEVPKSELSTVYQVKYLSRRITDEIRGLESEERYDGTTGCSAMVGGRKGISISYNYEEPPRTPLPSESDFWYRLNYSDTYFSAVIRGII